MHILKKNPIAFVGNARKNIKLKSEDKGSPAIKQQWCYNVLMLKTAKKNCN